MSTYSNVVEQLKKKAADRADILTSLDQFYVREKSKSNNNAIKKMKKSGDLNANPSKRMRVNENLQNNNGSTAVNASNPLASNINVKVNAGTMHNQYKCRNIMEFLTLYAYSSQKQNVNLMNNPQLIENSKLYSRYRDQIVNKSIILENLKSQTDASKSIRRIKK